MVVAKASRACGVCNARDLSESVIDGTDIRGDSVVVIANTYEFSRLAVVAVATEGASCVEHRCHSVIVVVCVVDTMAIGVLSLEE